MAACVLAALFVMPLASSVLWPGAPAGPTESPPLPPTESPFPRFTMGPQLRTVTVDAGANLSTRLLLTSLQGLVNRVEVELYLDVGGLGSNTSSLLSYVAGRYNVTYDPPMSTQAAIDMYAARATGLVVYDPSRPESINIGTVIAARRGAALVGPDLAGWLNASYRMPILFDYARTDWTSLDAIGAYDRALRDPELYPSSYPHLLSILPPDRWAIRDYLIQTGTFVFYLPQGALASPFETAATMRILHAARRGIPILGWFESPTLTEENSFVQMASREGKFVVGVQDLPNLSVLTALGRNETHRQVLPPSSTNRLENKTYVVLAVPDGDNLDFVTGRMWDLWSDPIRGTIPFAWSLSPLLVDLAPPLVEMYYDTATAGDRFVAAPSGAGYLYPDYADPGDLAAFVAFSQRYLNASDMDVLWLLNAFPASEIPYSPASLAAYVDGLRPEGIILDYADQPRTRDAWMVAGAQAIAPVIRSTHFWTTADNVLGKLDAAMATWDGGPHFVWLTVYSFRFSLGDARALTDALAARLGGSLLEVVTPTEFFGLLRQDFVRTAKARLEAMEKDPMASLLFGARLASTRARLRDAEAYLAAGDANGAANAAHLALEDLRAISAAEALIASLLVVLVAGALAFVAHRSSRSGNDPAETVRPAVLLLVTMAVAFFVFAIREALAQNFWTYPTILIGIAVAGVHRPLRRILDRAYPERAPVVAALTDLVFVALAIRTTAAFPLAVIGTLLVVDTYLSRQPGGSAEILAGLTFGTAIGFLAGFDLLTFSTLAVLLVVPALGVRGPPVPEASGRGPRALLPGFLLALPLSALSVAFYYSTALRLELQGELLSTVAGALLVLGPTVAILVCRAVPRGSATASEIIGLALAAALSGVVLASRGAVPVSLALLGLFASLSYAALAGLDAHVARGGNRRRVLSNAILLLPLFLLFFRAPPIVYSLTTVGLPEPIEYALYAPTVMIAGVALALAVLVGTGARMRGSAGKDYPGEAHGGTGGP